MTGGPLSRTEIVDAALAHARSGNLDRLSLRGLAGELGVTPMALYRHVGSKDDLLEAVTDRLLGEAGLPGDDLAWPDHLAALAGSLRSVLEAQPAVAALFTRRPVLGPVAVARLRGARQVLARAGFAPDDADHAYAAMHTYTLGFGALEAGRRRRGQPAADLDPDQQVIVGMVSEEQFHLGLRAQLLGLATLAG